MPCPRRFLPLVLLMSACGPPAFEGLWAGECLGEPTDLRLELQVTRGQAVQEGSDTPDDDAPTVDRANVTLTRTDRPGEALFLLCDDVLRDGWDVTIDACSGTWPFTDEGEAEPVTDVVLEGTLDEDGLVPRLLGSCQGDGVTGDLELWWVP